VLEGKDKVESYFNEFLGYKKIDKAPGVTNTDMADLKLAKKERSMKTIITLYEDCQDGASIEDVKTELDFSVALTALMKGIRVAAFDDLYEVDEIMSFDLTENVIEIKVTRC